MSFHNVLFPESISYGSSGGPGFSTEVTSLDNGYEQRISRWSRPRYQYDVSYGIRSRAELAVVRNFYIARMGAAYAFRFKDFLDFTSALDGVSTPTALDQECVQITNRTYQLVKHYVSGPSHVIRPITKPVEGTVSVKYEGVDVTPEIDYSTGVITFATAPGISLPTAGFEFHVPVRFGVEVDDVLSTRISGFDVVDLPSINLYEVFETTTTTDEYFYGGSKIVALAGHDLHLSAAEARIWRIGPILGSQIVYLPEITDKNAFGGGPWFVIHNFSNTNNLFLHTGFAPLATIPPNETVQVFFIANDAYQWVVV